MKSFSIKKVLIALTILVLLRSLYFQFVHAMVMIHRPFEPAEPGSQYISFVDNLVGVPRVGYLTNKDISPEKNDGFFLQAQYYLAPTIIDLQRPKHEFFIIDSLDMRFILATLKAFRASRITNTEYGQCLYKRVGY